MLTRGSCGEGIKCNLFSLSLDSTSTSPFVGVSGISWSWKLHCAVIKIQDFHPTTKSTTTTRSSQNGMKKKCNLINFFFFFHCISLPPLSVFFDLSVSLLIELSSFLMYSQRSRAATSVKGHWKLSTAGFRSLIKWLLIQQKQMIYAADFLDCRRLLLLVLFGSWANFQSPNLMWSHLVAKLLIFCIFIQSTEKNWRWRSALPRQEFR